MRIYIQILKQTLTISWRHKTLWLFGFFIALVSNNGEYNFILSQAKKIIAGNTLIDKMIAIFNAGIVKNYFAILFDDPLRILLISLVVIILLAAFILIVVMAQIAIIRGVKEIHNKKNRLKLWAIISSGRQYLGKTVAINILAQIIFTVLLFLAGLNLQISAFNKGDLFVNIFCGLITIIIIVLIIIINITLQFSSRYVILNNMGVLPAVRAGLVLFKKHWLTNLVFSLILFIITIIIGGIIAAVSFYVFSLPFIVTIVTAQKTIFNSLLGLAFFLLIIISIFANSFLSVFYYSGWTLFFIKLESFIVNNPIINRVGLTNKFR